ncbi:uncharacterized protein Tco025E_01357 [Trypanosoma conorhini]|uniref:Uncharacterized protein n=1 Tax=Trypanosoma conorhini TaxID=83891 RepID=A0A422Q9H3_9TRYP|nr:uncharacterized protein Tco025E_01357 [Trypanosoma conorhini]RNF26587.1 hypothetical protein Tco025E_01357 [Trypanosoma conorhini]
MRDAQLQSPTLLGESPPTSGVRLVADSHKNCDLGYAACATGATTSCVGVGDASGQTREYFCPVFVPSKSRHHTGRGTISLLIQDKVPFTLVVQPEERTLYDALVDRLVKKWWGDAGDDASQWLPQHPGPQQDSWLPSQVLGSAPPCTPPPRPGPAANTA